MDCGSSKSAMLAILLLGILSVVVDSADTRIVKGPECKGHSKDREYNKRVTTLLKNLVEETKNVAKNHHRDYDYTQNFPNSDKGSITGHATCDSSLFTFGCKNCLKEAMKKLNHGCESTMDGSIKLVDCSISFSKIV